MISIITATFNAEKNLPQLIASLRAQTNSDFRWIVADGGSTDNTLQIIEQNLDLVVKLISGPDFGIYDALNKALREVDTKYYLTLGADDLLHPDAVENYNKLAETSDKDFISASVRTSDGVTLIPNRGNPFRYGHLAYVSQHAVGTLIKTSLHKTVGQYSRRFPIAADRYFIRKTIEQHNGSVQAVNFEAGIYSCAGISSSQYYDSLLDIYKVDYALSKSPMLTAIINLLRYLIRLNRMAKKS
jgi:glycosyltransferase involved in cell wall biosynthesis